MSNNRNRRRKNSNYTQKPRQASTNNPGASQDSAPATKSRTKKEAQPEKDAAWYVRWQTKHAYIIGFSVFVLTIIWGIALPQMDDWMARRTLYQEFTGTYRFSEAALTSFKREGIVHTDRSNLTAEEKEKESLDLKKFDMLLPKFELKLRMDETYLMEIKDLTSITGRYEHSGNFVLLEPDTQSTTKAIEEIIAKRPDLFTKEELEETLMSSQEVTSLKKGIGRLYYPLENINENYITGETKQTTYYEDWFNMEQVE